MKTIVVLAMALMPLALSAPSASEVSLLLQKYSAFAKESSRSLSRVTRQAEQPNQSSTPNSTALPSSATVVFGGVQAPGFLERMDAKCLGEQYEPGASFTVSCVPSKKPKECSDESWKEWRSRYEDGVPEDWPEYCETNSENDARYKDPNQSSDTQIPAQNNTDSPVSTSTALPSQASQEADDLSWDAFFADFNDTFFADFADIDPNIWPGSYIVEMVEHIEKVCNYTLLYYGCDVFTLDDEGYFTWTVKELVKNSTEFVDYVMDYDLFSLGEYNYTRIAVEVAAQVVTLYECGDVTPSTLGFEDHFKAAELAAHLHPEDLNDPNMINMAADFLVLFEEVFNCTLQLSTESEGFTVAFLSTMRDSIWESDENANGKDILMVHMAKLIEKVGCEIPDAFEQFFDDWFNSFNTPWSVMVLSGLAGKLSEYLTFY